LQDGIPPLTINVMQLLAADILMAASVDFKVPPIFPKE
jgi:hypothetical protein